MRFQSLLLTFVMSASLSLIGCFGGDDTKTPEENKNTVTPNVNTSAKSNSNTPDGTVKTPTPETLNKAETVKPIVNAYCTAMQKKDDAALLKIYSQASLKQLQTDMREEGVRSLAEYLSNEPVGNQCLVRNEKVSGDAAIALVTTQTYPNGIQWKFVKENGAWKMTNQSSDFDAVRNASKRSGK